MDDSAERRQGRGLADIDAAASTSWLPSTGLPWALLPVLLLLVVVLAAIEGVLLAGGVLALGAGFFLAHLFLRRR